MDFLKNNKGLVALVLAVVLTALAAFTKVDVSALLGSVTTLDKQVSSLADEVVPPEPLKTETPKPPVE